MPTRFNQMDWTQEFPASRASAPQERHGGSSQTSALGSATDKHVSSDELRLEAPCDSRYHTVQLCRMSGARSYTLPMDRFLMNSAGESGFSNVMYIFLSRPGGR